MKKRTWWEGKDNPHFNNGFTINKEGRAFIYDRNKKIIPWARIIYQNHFLSGKEVPQKYHIHHINRNPSDDSPTNLQMITKSAHSKLHHDTHNSFWEHRQVKISIQKGEEVRSFNSKASCARFLGVSRASLSKKRKNRYSPLMPRETVKGWTII
jgi:hypothetical protein